MAKTAAQANAKWVASTQVGTETWATNLQNTTKPIVAKAIENRAIMQQKFAAATAPGGLWEQRLSAVGDAGIKAAAQAKKGNYATGVQQGSAAQLASITKIIAFEQAGLPAIYSMASGTTAAGIARASAWITYMASGKGQLSA